MKKYENRESFIRFLNDLRKALKTFGVETTEIKESEKNRFDFYIRNSQLNIFRLTNELPPVYASDKEKILKEIMKRVKDIIEKEKNKIELYKKTIALREKYSWGSRKIAKKLGIRKSLVDNWIYHENKPRLLNGEILN